LGKGVLTSTLVRVVAVLITVLFVTLVPHVLIAENTTEEGLLDPAPLLKMLNDALSLITDGRYGEAQQVCMEAEQVVLPSEIAYAHSRLYGRLLELISLIEEAGRVCKHAEPRSPEVKVVLYELCAVKLELENKLPQYVGELSKYFRDPSTKYVMLRSIKGTIASFLSKLSSDINKLIEVYLQGSSGGRVIKVTLSLPEEVLGGSTLRVTVKVTSNVSIIRLANLTVIATFANSVTEVVNETVEVGSQEAVAVAVPSAEALARAGVGLDEELPIKVVAIASALVGGEEFVAYAAANSKLIFTRPRIAVVVPSFVYPNQAVNVTVVARTNATLEARVYLDEVSDDHLILEMSVEPGVNSFLLNFENLSVGYHKLYLVTEPTGPYLSLTHSSAFAVVEHPLVAVAELPELAVAPPFAVVLHVYVDTPVPYEVAVLVGGREVLRSTFVNKSRVSLTVPLPPTPLMWRYEVEVEVRALSPSYGSATKLLATYVVNLPVLTAAVAALGLAMVTPASSRYISISLKSVLSRFRSQRAELVRSTLQVAEEVTVARFRRPKLLKLYRRFTSLISRYVSPPKRSETLREFLRRLKLRTSDWVQKLAWRFISIYEADLYSHHDVDVREAGEVIRKLEGVRE